MLERRGGLVSLLEMMRHFHVGEWLRLSAAVYGIGHTASWQQLEGEDNPYGPIFEHPNWPEKLKEWAETCDELELRASAATLRKIMRLEPTADDFTGSITALFPELHGRLLDEMDNVMFLALEPSSSRRYEHPRDGWAEVIERFPEALSDIEESSKCFALGRYAASVYHSTQVVEFGAIALGKLVGVNDPKKGFTATTAALKKLIAKPHPEWDQALQGYYQAIKQIHERLLALEDSWRNKINHADGKLALLTADFTPEVADDIGHATRAFMLRLASELPVGSS